MNMYMIVRDADILIDMYGEELRRSIVKVGDIEWVASKH